MSVRSYTRTTWTRRIRVLGVSLACLLIVAAQEARAQFDQSIYFDALGAGWQDWSWCVRDLNSTDFIHSETRSAKVTYTAWQGRQGAISNAFVQGGSVAAGTWRKVTIPLSALNADNKTNFNGFWLQDSSGGAQAAFYVDDITLTAVPPPSQVEVMADASVVRRTIDPRLFGVAAAVWDSHFNTPATTSLLSENLTGLPRQAAISVGARTLTVIQDGDRTDDCRYPVVTSSSTLPSQGGDRSINLVTHDHCAWQAVSSQSWITVTSAAAGIGSNTVSYTVAPNLSGVGRKGVITVGGQPFSIKQRG